MPPWGAGYRPRILHISDLHVRGPRERDQWRRRRVLGEAWQENLAAIAGDGDIDLVCFTSDVAFSGKEDEHAEATAFLDATLERRRQHGWIGG